MYYKTPTQLELIFYMGHVLIKVYITNELCGLQNHCISGHVVTNTPCTWFYGKQFLSARLESTILGAGA